MLNVKSFNRLLENQNFVFTLWLKNHEKSIYLCKHKGIGCIKSYFDIHTRRLINIKVKL